LGKHFDSARAAALVDLLRPARLTRVVEVGANPVNANPYSALMRMGQAEVWGFEPDERAFARLMPGDRETYLPHAVGDGTPGTFHICRVPSLSSLLPPDPRTTAFFARLERPTTVERTVPIETVRIDDVDAVPEFDLLKIDVQGGELQVYEGAREKLGKVAAVIAEVAFVPLYVGQPLLDAQMACLRESGLDFHKFLFLKGFSLRGGLNTRLDKARHDNHLLDGDAVFIRSLRTPEVITTETLKHLAVLAETVFESFDVTLRCLDLLIARGAIDAGAAEAYARRLPDQGAEGTA
jgi:FkbM family methyltransferase